MNRKKEGFSGKLLSKWLRPTPISEFDGEYELEILSLHKVLSLKNPNKLPNLGRISFNAIANRYLETGFVGLNKQHIDNLIEDWAPTAKGLVVIATRDKIVWDGSHRLTALAVNKALGQKGPVTHVAVFWKKGKVS